SSAPAASSGSATSCCGSSRIPSFTSALPTGRTSTPRRCRRRSPGIASANAASAAPAGSSPRQQVEQLHTIAPRGRRPLPGRESPMLKQRIVTAAVLLTAIVWALFFAAPWVWGVLSLVLFAAAGWEWGALLGRAGPVGGDGGAGEGADASAGSRAAIGVTAAVTVAGLAWLAWRGGFELGAGTDGTGPWLAALLVVDLLLWLGLALPAVLAAKPRGDHPAFATVAIFCLWVAVLELRLIHPVSSEEHTSDLQSR